MDGFNRCSRLCALWMIPILLSLTGCPDDGAGPASNQAGGLSASANDFGGSGVVLPSSLAAPFVVFQDNSTSRMINRDGGATKQNGVNSIYSIGAYVDPNDGNRVKFFVNDRSNHRVLIFNNVPQDVTAVPDVVVGQSNFTSGTANAGGATSAAGFNESVYVSVCSNGKMFVADRNNHRVLAYNRIPTASGTAADFVIGQPDFTSNGSGTSATTLNLPYASYCMANKLFVVEQGNNRILVFDPIPTTSTPTATYVIGQPDFVTGTVGCTAAKMSSPYEILRVGDNFYVADGGNHRVLRFDTIPAATGATANAVLGQADFVSCQPNRGLVAPADNTLNFPNALAAKDNRLAVSDHTNNRIMFFSLPATTNQSAVAQLGQPGFVTATLFDPPTASTVRSTKGLLFSPQHLVIGDGQNHRVAVIALP